MGKRGLCPKSLVAVENTGRIDHASDDKEQDKHESKRADILRHLRVVFAAKVVDDAEEGVAQ